MVSVSDGLVLRCNSFTGLRYARKRTSIALYRRWLCRGNVFPYFSPVRLEANFQKPLAFWLSLCLELRVSSVHFPLEPKSPRASAQWRAGNELPNIGRPLLDRSWVASSWMTSQCSTRIPSSMWRMSAAIQFAGAPNPEKRPWTMTSPHPPR